MFDTIKNLMEQLKSAQRKESIAYGNYMYYEAAERGYDAEASRKAHTEWLDAAAECDKLEKQIEELRSILNENKPTYMVVGVVDPSCGDDSAIEVSPWVATFSSKEDADKACEMVNDFYYNKCKIPCNFEVREITSISLEDLQNDLDAEYEYRNQ